MGKFNGLYRAEFPAGTHVRVAAREFLEQFMHEWQLHNPLLPEQLQFAGARAEVVEVGYYHGGDELYQLKNIPGIWHEVCLAADHVG